MPKKEKKETAVRVEAEARYEISMYKLIIIVLIGMFISIGIGYAVGNAAGASAAVDNAKIPSYCAIHKVRGQAEVRCTELNIAADKFCEILSPELEKQVKVMLVTD